MATTTFHIAVIETLDGRTEVLVASSETALRKKLRDWMRFSVANEHMFHPSPYDDDRFHDAEQAVTLDHNEQTDTTFRNAVATFSEWADVTIRVETQKDA